MPFTEDKFKGKSKEQITFYRIEGKSNSTLFIIRKLIKNNR